jgi:ATP-binding cassette subfamily B protein
MNAGATGRSGAVPDGRPPDRRPWRFLWSYIRARPGSFALLAAVVIGAGACAVTVQYSMKLIVDAMTVSPRANADVWTPLALFLGMIVLESVLWRSSGWLGCRTVIACCVDMRLDLFRYLTGHSMQYFAQHLSGSLGNRITATAGAAGAVLNTLTWNIVPPCVDFIGAVILLLSVDWRLALTLMVAVALVAVGMFAYGIRGRPLHRAFGEEGARVNGEIVDTVAHVWAVKAFSARGREEARLAAALGIESQAQRRSWMFIEKSRVMHDVCVWTLAGGMMVWTLRAWQSGTLSAGDVVLVSALTFRIVNGARDLALALVGSSQHVGVIHEMLQVVAEPHAVDDVPGASPEAPTHGLIEFRDVAFTHASGHRVFERFNLKIPAGQRIGIMGPSGGGKSTLVGLVQRLADVQGGMILIDGRPITEYTQDGLRAGIAVVPQDTSLFRRTVMENIRYGNPRATDDEVRVAAEAAFCDGFIRRLRHGYDTMIGERGATLSGGQRQRIGIARAVLKNAPILIFDEATSALDSHSEREVKAGVRRLLEGRTVIAIAHRISSLRSFDRIVVLQGGHIIADGTPSEVADQWDAQRVH